MSELRAHLPERDAYLDRLAQHYADGLLDDAGFETRRDQLLQATTHGEMLRVFDGLPRPRYAQDGQPRRSGASRRALLIGGIAAVGIVGAGALGIGGFFTVGASDPQPTFAGEIVEEGFSGTPVDFPIDFSALDEVHMTLMDRGLTEVSEFHVAADGVTATVMSPRAPGEYHSVNKQVERPVVISEPMAGEAQLTVELEQLYNSLIQAYDEAPWALGGEGYADRLTLVFTERGTPTVVANVLDWDGAQLGTAQYDLNGNLINLEENR